MDRANFRLLPGASVHLKIRARFWVRCRGNSVCASCMCMFELQLCHPLRRSSPSSPSAADEGKVVRGASGVTIPVCLYLFLFLLLFCFLVFFCQRSGGSVYLSIVCMFTCDLSPSTTRVCVCTLRLFPGFW